MPYRYLLPTLLALTLSACGDAPPTPHTKQEPTTQARPATADQPAPKPQPDTSPAATKPKLDLAIPELELNEPQPSANPGSESTLPDLFAAPGEKDLELDGSVKMDDAASLTSPRADGVELQVKSRF